MVINSTHSLLTGGGTESGSLSTAYLYSENGGFNKIEDMKTPRQDHVCSVINNTTMLVTGGAGYYGSKRRSSESLDLTTLTWSPGPELPERVYPEQMVGNILIGRRKIFKLVEEVLPQRKQWRWTYITEMKHTRDYAWAFVVNQNVFCKN